MDEHTIKQFSQGLSKWCWDHDFVEFCAVTGFTGTHAEDQWIILRDLNVSLASFDPKTLARILGF